jgi:hypothetical protein
MCARKLSSRSVRVLDALEPVLDDRLEVIDAMDGEGDADAALRCDHTTLAGLKSGA